MKIVIVSAANRQRHAASDLVDTYLERIKRYCRGAHLETIKDDDKVEARFEKLCDKYAGRGLIVALEVEGNAASSQHLAKIIENAQLDAKDTLLFLVGGAYGMPKAISRRADIHLSLSKMTFPHALVQAMLAEQVYRAFTILRGEPYSH